MKLDRPYAPLGLSRDEAAYYLGIGTTLFDQLVEEGTLPRPKRMHGRKLWDRRALEFAFADLPEDGGNAIDKALGRAAASA
jgi:hypothetical protein